MSFLEKFKSKYPYDSTTSGIPDEYFSDTIYKIGKEDENENKELIIPENKSSNNKYVKRDYNFKKMNNNDYINNDPFKYHPNYNSIYKNIPSARITVPKNQSIKERNKGKQLFKLKEKMRTNKLLLTEINTSGILGKNNQKKDKNNINKTVENINHIKLPKLAKLNIINNEQIKNNHALRFSKYLPRKFIIPENNKNISYINPFNYLIPKNRNKSIDFEKMSQRNSKTLINTSSLKIPSFGQYNPNYKWIDRDKNIISFNPEEKEEGKYKKYLIKKLWSSYKVNTEYQLIDNNKLKK